MVHHHLLRLRTQSKVRVEFQRYLRITGIGCAVEHGMVVTGCRGTYALCVWTSKAARPVEPLRGVWLMRAEGSISSSTVQLGDKEPEFEGALDLSLGLSEIVRYIPRDGKDGN